MPEDSAFYERWASQGETSKAYAKFLLYRNMKPDKRSLLGAYTLHMAEVKKGITKAYKCVPGSWRDLAEKWHWKERAEAWDKDLQLEQEERERQLREFEASEIERILTTGYAATHKRIEALDAMARAMEVAYKTKDEREIPLHAMPERLREWRGLLDDIAKEVGGRVKKDKLEHSGSVEIRRNPDLAALTDEELEQLAALLLKAEERRNA